MKESLKDYSPPRVQKYRQRKKESQLTVKISLTKLQRGLSSSERTSVGRATKLRNNLELPRQKK